MKHLLKHDLIDRRRDAVDQSGLSFLWLERLEHEQGTQALIQWLEVHNFWELRDQWLNTNFLLGKEDQPITDSRWLTWT